MTKKTYYEALNVSRNADPEIIKAAYTILAQRYRLVEKPDDLDAEQTLKILDRAYDVLSDPMKRAGYDAALAENDEYAVMSSHESRNSHTASRTKYNPHLKWYFGILSFAISSLLMSIAMAMDSNKLRSCDYCRCHFHRHKIVTINSEVVNESISFREIAFHTIFKSTDRWVW